MFAISTCMCARVRVSVCVYVPLVNLSNKSCKRQQQKTNQKRTHTATIKNKKKKETRRRKITQNVMMLLSVDSSTSKSRPQLVWAGHKNMSIIKSHAWEGRGTSEWEKESHSPGKRHVNRKKGFQQNRTIRPGPCWSCYPRRACEVHGRRRGRRSNSNKIWHVAAAAAPPPLSKPLRHLKLDSGRK